MTHDELLANINDQFYPYDNLANALRSIVELHEPHKIVWTDYITEIYCATCGDATWVPYPCATIQVIEKELQ